MPVNKLHCKQITQIIHQIKLLLYFCLSYSLFRMLLQPSNELNRDNTRFPYISTIIHSQQLARSQEFWHGDQ